MDEVSLPNPGYTPYYGIKFFSTIKEVHNNSTLNIMSVSQWYRILLEDWVTMVQEDSGVSRQLVPCRI